METRKQQHDDNQETLPPERILVFFSYAPFAKLVPLPTNGKPVTRWRNRDLAFVDIALEIERLIHKLRPSSFDSEVIFQSSLGKTPPPQEYYWEPIALMPPSQRSNP